MSMQNMQSVSWTSGVYNNLKKLVSNKIKLYVITNIFIYNSDTLEEEKARESSHPFPPNFSVNMTFFQIAL